LIPFWKPARPGERHIGRKYFRKDILMNNRLLISEPPLQVLPSLAVKVGLNQAIFLQQLHYWLQKSNHKHAGKRWVYNTYEGWREQFPFWRSLTTLKLIVKRLVDAGLVITTDKYNKKPTDRTLWYTIDYKKLNELAWIDVSPDDLEPEKAEKPASVLPEARSWSVESPDIGLSDSEVEPAESPDSVPSLPERTEKAERQAENSKKSSFQADDPLLRPKPKPSPGEIHWITAYGDLQLQLPRETFNTWLRNAKLLSCEDGVFTIGVDNQYAVEWLKHRLHKVVSDTLRRIVEKEVSVNYVLLPNGAGQGV
jgi:hypothetical protein